MLAKMSLMVIFLTAKLVQAVVQTEQNHAMRELDYVFAILM